jgi:hypothetical protein
MKSAAKRTASETLAQMLAVSSTLVDRRIHFLFPLNNLLTIHHQRKLSPPFPPAAERCALTCVESIICVSVDRPFPASSRNRFSQMPRRAQRTKRL